MVHLVVRASSCSWSRASLRAGSSARPKSPWSACEHALSIKRPGDTRNATFINSTWMFQQIVCQIYFCAVKKSHHSSVIWMSFLVKTCNIGTIIQNVKKRTSFCGLSLISGLSLSLRWEENCHKKILSLIRKPHENKKKLKLNVIGGGPQGKKTQDQVRMSC